MIVGHDITKVIENLRLEKDISTVNLMSSYLSHEMITPLRCVQKLTKKINKSTQKSETEHYSQVVDQTIHLLLSNIKNSLDSTLLNSN
jgi:light-regulated signal transduction histidine kinase (bacteriophytochrome)